MKKNTSPVPQIVSLIASLLVTACAHHAPVPETAKTDDQIRQWVAKAELFDKRKDRKHSVDMDILAVGEQRLRLEVTGTMAVTLAVAVMNGNELTCLLPREKKYYQGPATAAALAKTIRVPFDPKWISAMVRDKEIQGASWSCEKDEKALPKKCESLQSSRSVIWSERRDDSKKVVIADPNYEISLKLNEVPTKVQDQGKAFSLNVPSSYAPLGL